VPYFAWAGAEVAVAMVCVGIPTLRPLYLKARGITSVHESKGRSNASELPRFTMLKDRPAGAERPLGVTSWVEADIPKPPNVYVKSATSWQLKS
jgi:hypothetical protein